MLGHLYLRSLTMMHVFEQIERNLVTECNLVAALIVSRNLNHSSVQLVKYVVHLLLEVKTAAYVILLYL